VLAPLAARFPDMELATPPHDLEWHNNIIMPGPRSVPVTV
jgi:hypothetical protein